MMINATSLTFKHSALTNVGGNQYQYNFNNTPPSEYGIDRLFNASCPDAIHDSRARSPPARCLEDTRVPILRKISDWIAVGDEKILWISGPAGSGKSAIAQTIAEACTALGTLAASFFFFRGAQGRDSPDHLVASISHQIVTKLPEKRAELGEIIAIDPSILHKPLFVQLQTLVIPLFARSPDGVNTVPSLSYPPLTPFLVVIDGLDECSAGSDQQEIVESLGRLVNSFRLALRFIILSRPETPIENAFNNLSCSLCRMPLQDSKGSYGLRSGSGGYLKYYEEQDRDIATYLRHEFNSIYRDHNLRIEGFWPSFSDINTLVQKSRGMFIYASTLIKYVGERDFSPIKRLKEILDYPPCPQPFMELDRLYRLILGVYNDRELLLRVLAVVCILKQPGSSKIQHEDIERLLHLWKGEATTVLRHVHSVLDVQTWKFHHKSFADFIHNKQRAGEYFIDEKKAHASMTQMLSTYLPQRFTRPFWSPN